MTVPDFAEPPWEWVEGDPIEAARYGMVLGLFLGAVLTLVAVIVAVIVGEATFGTFLPAPPFWLIWVGEGLVVLVGCLLIRGFPRWYPVVTRLGISPLGLRLALPRREIRFGWDGELAVGPDWVQGRFELGHPRFRLTARQSERLHRFVRVG